MINSKFSISNIRNEPISIILKQPEFTGPFPTIILVQGIGMDMHEYKNSHDEIADSMVMAGFAVIQFDFSYKNKVTERADHELPLNLRSQELDDVISWASTQRLVDSSRIGIYAMSFGVSTVLLSKRLAQIKSLCLSGGIGFRPANFIQRFVKKGATINKQGVTNLPRSSGKTLIVRPDFWPPLDSLVQENLAEKLRLPVFVIHGDKDSYVRVNDMQMVFDSIPTVSKKLKIFKNGDHGIIDVPTEMRSEVLNDIINWFKNTL